MKKYLKRLPEKWNHKSSSIIRISASSDKIHIPHAMNENEKKIAYLEGKHCCNNEKDFVHEPKNPYRKSLNIFKFHITNTNNFWMWERVVVWRDRKM